MIQIFSYPGDYVRPIPTARARGRDLMKCEEDFLQVDQAPPRAPRRALVRIGEPIDLTARWPSEGRSRSRQLVPALTSEIEGKLQALLDAMPPGRSLNDTRKIRGLREKFRREARVPMSWRHGPDRISD